MFEVSLKPLSVNEAWQGRRFKTRKYKQYQKDLTLLLPKSVIIPKGKLKIEFVFGTSSTLSDYDNFIKQTQDIIAKKYKFDDKLIFEAHIKKQIVPKGKEFIHFNISSLKE